jgi:hypothetical protein
MVFNATFNNISVIPWPSVLFLENTTDLSQVTDKLFVNCKKGELDTQPQVIKFTSCLPMIGGSFQVLRLLPPLKLVAMKYC